MDEITTFILYAFLFYLAYKAGQISVWAQINQHDKSVIQTKLKEERVTPTTPVITVEEINGVYYAYDGNDFLAQGATPDEIGRSIAQRFPKKYALARVQIKA